MRFRKSRGSLPSEGVIGMAFKIEYRQDNKADEVVNADHYNEGDGWFEFLRSPRPGDTQQDLQVARIRSSGVNRVDVIEAV